MKKILIAGFMVISFICGLSAAGFNNPSVYVNGLRLSTDALLIDEKTYIPLRAVSEALGANVEWDQSAFAANITMETGNADAIVSNVIQTVSASVVAIVGDYDAASSSNKYADRLAHGTGVVIKSAGEILTNAHVVDGLNNIIVVLNDGSAYNGKIKYIDKNADLAVVKIDKLGLPVATFAKEENVSVGDTVIAIGTPISFSLRNSASKGIISGLNRGLFSEYALLQTDASVNPGNSGGPLVNLKGEVVGINSSKFSGVGIEGMCFSIPSGTVQYVLSQFEKYGEVKRAKISADLEENWAAKRGLPTNEGLTVQKVSGKASAEGLLVGDVIVAVDGSAIYSNVDFNECMKKYDIGSTAQFKLYRGGEMHLIDFTLE